MSTDVHLLQESLVAALRDEPLLIQAEEYLHSAQSRAARDELQVNLARLLDPGPAIAEFDRQQYRPLDGNLIERLRSAMQDAVNTGANLAEAEKQILESFGLSKVGELRTAMQSHLGGPAELPQRDLAIYVPAGDQSDEEFDRALQRDLQALELELEQEEPEQPPESEIPTKAEAVLQAPPAAVIPKQEKLALPVAPTAPTKEELRSPAGPAAVIPTQEELRSPAAPAAAIPTKEEMVLPADSEPGLRAALGLSGPSASEGGRLAKLNPVPMLAAALEAVGLGGEGFGFILRYGRYASEGRKSEFLIGGLGLAELSKRLTTWLDAQGPLKGQVQVIDEGSGELTIYLLLPEAA